MEHRGEQFINFDEIDSQTPLIIPATGETGEQSTHSITSINGILSDNENNNSSTSRSKLKVKSDTGRTLSHDFGGSADGGSSSNKNNKDEKSNTNKNTKTDGVVTTLTPQSRAHSLISIARDFLTPQVFVCWLFLLFCTWINCIMQVMLDHQCVWGTMWTDKNSEPIIKSQEEFKKHVNDNYLHNDVGWYLTDISRTRGFNIMEHLLNPDGMSGIAMMLCLVIVCMLHKERTKYLRRLWLINGCMYFLRAICLIATPLPAPFADCEIGIPKYNENYLYEGLKAAVLQRTTCCDCLFSGHTMMVVLSTLFVAFYLDKSLIRNYYLRMFIKFLMILYAIAAMGVICASKFHYTVDVVVAGILTIALFGCYSLILVYTDFVMLQNHFAKQRNENARRDVEMGSNVENNSNQENNNGSNNVDNSSTQQVEQVSLLKLPIICKVIRWLEKPRVRSGAKIRNYSMVKKYFGTFERYNIYLNGRESEEEVVGDEKHADITPKSSNHSSYGSQKNGSQSTGRSNKQNIEKGKPGILVKDGDSNGDNLAKPKMVIIEEPDSVSDHSAGMGVSFRNPILYKNTKNNKFLQQNNVTSKSITNRSANTTPTPTPSPSRGQQRYLTYKSDETCSTKSGPTCTTRSLSSPISPDSPSAQYFSDYDEDVENIDKFEDSFRSIGSPLSRLLGKSNGTRQSGGEEQ